LLTINTLLHPFNVPLSGITRVSRYQKGKTNVDLLQQDSKWQWHQLGHMQICTSPQIDNHASIPSLSFYRPYALPVAQPTASKHWRHLLVNIGSHHKSNLKNDRHSKNNSQHFGGNGNGI